MKKYTSEGRFQYELVESLVESANRLEEKGFTIRVINCGHGFEAYMDDDVTFENRSGYNYLIGNSIEVEETYRHNGTEKNVNIDFKLYKWNTYSGCLLGKGEKKIRMRMDASEKVKNARIEAIIDRYNRFK